MRPRCGRYHTLRYGYNYWTSPKSFTARNNRSYSSQLLSLGMIPGGDHIIVTEIPQPNYDPSGIE
jgi:hypothetical protein